VITALHTPSIPRKKLNTKSQYLALSVKFKGLGKAEDVTMNYTTPVLNNSNQVEQASLVGTNRKVRIVPIAMALGGFIAISFVLCVLFDLWFPQFAMYPAWALLLPGFTWISWGSFFIGLAESFAYGWYIALLFIPLYNFMNSRGKTAS